MYAVRQDTSPIDRRKNTIEQRVPRYPVVPRDRRWDTETTGWFNQQLTGCSTPYVEHKAWGLRIGLGRNKYGR